MGRCSLLDRWTCPACTLRHAASLAACHECGTRRPNASNGAGGSSSSSSSKSYDDVLFIDDDDEDVANANVSTTGRSKSEVASGAGHARLPPSASSSSSAALPTSKSSARLPVSSLVKPRTTHAAGAHSPIEEFSGSMNDDDDDGGEPFVGDEGGEEEDDDNGDEDDEYDARGSRPPSAKRARFSGSVAAKERAKAAKAEARAAKAAEKEAQKQAKKLATNSTRSEKGSFAEQEIVVVMSPDLAATETGDAIRAALTEAKYALLQAAPPGSQEVLSGPDDGYRVRIPDIPMSIHWMRRKVEPVLLKSFLPGVVREPFAARVFVEEAFLDVLVAGGTDGVEAVLQRERAALVPGSRLFYVLQGASAAALKWAQRSSKEQRDLDAGKRKKAARPLVTTDALEYALLHLYVSAELEVKETLNEVATAEYVVGLTRAVSEFPYRMHETALACVTKVKVSGGAAAAAAGDDGGGGKPKKSLLQVWQAQLQMIPGVSATRAAAIAARYPSFRSLVEAYRNPAMSERDKESLLADIGKDPATGSGTRLVKLSKDVYRFFTTKDPNEVIGASAGK